MYRKFLALLLLAGGLFSTSFAASFDVISANDRDSEVMIDETYKVSAGDNLNIKVSDADIEIMTEEGITEAHVQVILSARRDMEKAKEYFEDLEFEVEQNGNDIYIESTQRNRIRIQIGNYSSHGGAHVKVLVTIPTIFNGNIRTSDGDIRMGDLTGEMEIHTSDGDVKLANLTGDNINIRSSDGDISAYSLNGNLQIHTSDGDLRLGEISGETGRLRSSDGDIRVRKVNFSSLDVRTSDGDIDLEDASGSLTVSSGDGNIDVRVNDLNDSSFRTSDGNITIYAPADMLADIDLRGDRIRISNGFDFRGELKRKHAEGRINSGGATLKARSGDGHITLQTSDG